MRLIFVKNKAFNRLTSVRKKRIIEQMFEREEANENVGSIRNEDEN